MDIQVKNVRFNRAMSAETAAFTCSIWINGKKAGTAVNRGQGGETELSLPRDARAAAEAHARSLLGVTYLEFNPAFSVLMTLDMLVDYLAEEANHKAWLKRQCRRNTLVRVKGDEDGAFRTLNRPYSPSMAATIRGKFGADLLEIVNETLSS